MARVDLKPGNGNIIINGLSFERYLQYNKSPLSLLELEKNYDVVIKSMGGGLSGQSEAIKKLGIARGLYKIVETNNQRKLKTAGFLTRNSACKERRYGLKKARKASQFSKR
uniref:Ribosomal protein S9 n=1 Tax=Strombomonas acuminata TaxID=201859 RepID=I6NJX9_9EUGL|nr:ribosomal protein S9 [Strombomonas acuminata]